MKYMDKYHCEGSSWSIKHFNVGLRRQKKKMFCSKVYYYTP